MKKAEAESGATTVRSANAGRDSFSPSTASSDAIHLWPHPIAVLYQGTRLSNEPQSQWLAVRDFLEGLTRFLFWVSLADAVGKGPGPDLLQMWLKRAAKPGIGTNIEFVEKLTAWSAERGVPFLVEASALRRGDGWKWLRAYTTVRNTLAHDGHRSGPQLKRLLEEVRPHVSKLLYELNWLKQYRLGTIEQKRRSRRGRRHDWDPRRGQAEVGEVLKLYGPVDVDWPVLEEDELAPVLLDISRRRFLRLDPWLRVDSTTHPSPMLWLSGITKEGRGVGTYRHPYRRVQRERSLVGRKQEPGARLGWTTDDTGDVVFRARVEPGDVEPCTFDDWRRLDLSGYAAGSYQLDEESHARLNDASSLAFNDERFSNLRLLGEGGSSHVYVAMDGRLGRQVVLKRMKDGHLNNRAARKRFVREAKTLARLDHDRIVKLYDIFEFEDAPVMVMEYLEGQTLRELVEREGPLDPSQAVELTRQVLDGLQYLHEKDYVHRDVKPSNVLLLRDGSIRILDLGIHKDLGSSANHTRTGTYSLMGSFGYMAPEQVSGGAISPATDLYGCAKMLEFLLSGKNPRPGHRRGNRSVSPGGLAAVLRRATADEASSRFGSAREMAAALESGATASGDRSPLAAYRVAYAARSPDAVGILVKLFESAAVSRRTALDEYRVAIADRDPDAVAVLQRLFRAALKAPPPPTRSSEEEPYVR